MSAPGTTDSPTGFTAIGVHKVGLGEAGRTINGVVFPVGAGEMAEFDDREAGYERVEIPPQMLQPVSWLAVPSEGRIWMYVPTGQRRGGDAGQFSPIAPSRSSSPTSTWS